MMTWDISDYLHEYGIWAVPISILLNIFISIAGVLPSVFLTAANIALFGPQNGTLVSIAGEALGAIVAFLLYRFGFRRKVREVSVPSSIQKLLHVEGREAFYWILLLRLLPFAPSGFVTLFAALGRVSLPIFAAASTLGKIPALLLEAYSTYQVVAGTSQAKWIIGLAALMLLFYLWRKKKA